MKKILLISVYFGKYPDYFNLWLKSAAKNPDIDFLLVGDCDVSSYEPLADNIKVLMCSFNDIKEKIQSKFDFKITLDKPYKLCDYRPVFPLIFSDELEGYDYWGHIDIDTILGDVSKYLPKEDYDKIYQFGHMSIYRNTTENNHRFMLDGGLDYKQVFQTSFNMIFDELAGMKKKFDLLGIPMYLSNDFADIARRRLSFTLNSEITRKNYKYQIFYYDNGHIFRDYFDNGKMHTDEFNYIHFSHRSMPDKTNGSNTFFITRFGFIEKKGTASLDDIKRLNAPTPVQDVFCTFNTQVIRRIKRISKRVITKLLNK